MGKIKQFIVSEKGKDILTVMIVVLVSLGSFELGRLSKESKTSSIKILPAQAGEYPSQNEIQSVNVISATNSTSKTFFASSRGKKYYSIGCSAGKTIKQENRVYFATREEAERAG